MTIARTHRTFTQLALVAALLAAMLAFLATPGTASAGHPHLGVAQARSAGPGSHCTTHLRQARAREMTPAQKRRTKRSLRDCRRRLASQSSAVTPKYWGAWVGSQLTGTEAPWDMHAISRFEQMAGRSMSLIQFSSPFANCSPSCSFYEFPREQMERIRSHGSIPFFSWASQATPATINQPDFQLSDVIAGTYDSYIREFAEAAKAWGHPFFLRFNWEMNGGWFAWAEGVNGNQPGEYVAAWRHVHDIFTEVGATNATWVWCPNVDPGGTMQDLASLYPGDEYVDWTGLDGYNWGTNPDGPKGWMSFEKLFSATYREITETIAPSKPLVISEIGSSEYGGSKSAWIEEALDSVPADYPKVRALLWFEKYDDGMDWPIETSASAKDAFSAGIQNPVFRGNSYSSLDASPIPAPQ